MQLQRRYYLEDFIDFTRRVASRNDLFSAFISAMADLGYDRVNFTVKYAEHVPQRFLGFGLINTYPADWQGRYIQNNWAEIDPVLRAAQANCDPFTWAGLERTHPLSRQQIKFMRLAEKAGLWNGVGIPFNGPNAQIGGVALATSTRDRWHETDLNLLVAYSHMLFTTYKRLVREAAPEVPAMPKLSKKEELVLVSAAQGRHDPEIAQVLEMSKHTVDMHFRNIYRKLGARNRYDALTKALTWRLIDP